MTDREGKFATYIVLRITVIICVFNLAIYSDRVCDTDEIKRELRLTNSGNNEARV